MRWPKWEKIDWFAYALIAIFIVVFVFLSFGRHDSLKSYLNDIGMFDQVVWNTSQGRFFQFSASMNDETNLLTSRFSIILLFFVPLYWIMATPKWLLLFQVLSVGASAVPIYLLSKEKLKSPVFGLLFLVSYLLYPPIQNGLLYDFHELVLAVAFASWAFYFMEKNNDKGFLVCSAFLMISQEFLALLVLMMGLYLAFIKKRVKFGLGVSAAALAYFSFLTAFFMPHISRLGRHGMLSNPKASYYSWLGSSLKEILVNIATNPSKILYVIFSRDRMIYIFHLVAPVFSLALYSWPVAVIIPIVLLYVLSATQMTYTVYFYHAVILAPFIYFSAIYTFERWFLENDTIKKTFAMLLLASSLDYAIVFGVSPLSTHYKFSDYIPSQHAKLVSEVEKAIPEDASLSVQHNLGPHFSHRQKLYAFPLKKDEVRYILLDKFNPYENSDQLFSFEYALQMDASQWMAEIDRLKASPDYSLVLDKDGYMLFEKKN